MIGVNIVCRSPGLDVMSQRKQGTARHSDSGLDVGLSITDEIASGVIQADVVRGHAEARVEDASTLGNGASELRCRFPDDLREVVVRRNRGIVFGFVQSELMDGVGDWEVAGGCDDVFTVWLAEQGTIRVLNLASIGPGLCLGCQRAIPYQVLSTVQGAHFVVGVEIRVFGGGVEERACGGCVVPGREEAWGIGSGEGRDEASES